MFGDMITMNNIFLAGIVYLSVVNLAAFFVMYLDKARSRKTGAERIPEGVMFFAAAALGSVGVLAGMFAFRHKTAKWYFMMGMPLLILQNSAVLYLARILWLK